MSVTVYLKGHIDSNNANSKEQEILGQLDGCASEKVILDASHLLYISSAGLRILLRLKKRFSDLTVTDVSPEVYEILEMTGFTEILTVEKAYRRVSVDGCEVIGEGANGKVYRIGDDTVVKTYKNADALSEIQHEREVARTALILGIPTAIPYDVVKVGDSYGSVFELLNASSFSKILAEEPERFEWCAQEYVKLLKLIHSTVVPDGKLPSAALRAKSWVDRVAGVLPPDYGEKLKRLFEAIPEQHTMIHGDYHTKNIVLAEGEVLLIDMDTLSVGHPIFEFLQMYNSYIGFGEYNSGIIARFQGFSAGVARDFWKRVLELYFDTDEKTLSDIEDKIRCLAYVRLIDWSIRHRKAGNHEDRQTREMWTQKLLMLLDKLQSLDFDTVKTEKSGPDELEIDALIENLPQVEAFVEERLEAAACPMPLMMKISIAVEEVFVNIAHYAYGDSVGKAIIRMEILPDPTAAVITFIDSGVPYNPLKKVDPDVTLSAEERQIGGLGIFITKKTMDEVTYAYQDGKNILTLKKCI